jgi:hypothetical protein
MEIVHEPLRFNIGTMALYELKIVGIIIVF